jgi:hypothetical protein
MKQIMHSILAAGIFLGAGRAGAQEAPLQVAAAAETVYVTNKGDTLFHLKARDSSRGVEKVEEVKIPSLLVQSGKDTLVILKKSSVEDLVKNISHNVKKSRELGYGGAGGVVPAMLLVNVNPLRNVINREAGLRSADFGLDHRFEPFYMMGGMGYGGLGQGIRIGGGGWGGTRIFTTEPANARVTEIKVDLTYGGFLVEKCLVRDSWNLIVGGMLGGGTLRMEKYTYASDSGISVFSRQNSLDTLDPVQAEASLYSLELHSAFTYTLLPWFHLGAEINAAGFFSEGFGGGNGSFVTGNPGLKLRIIFGNIG